MLKLKTNLWKQGKFFIEIHLFSLLVCILLGIFKVDITLYNTNGQA